MGTVVGNTSQQNVCSRYTRIGDKILFIMLELEVEVTDIIGAHAPHDCLRRIKVNVESMSTDQYKKFGTKKKNAWER